MEGRGTEYGDPSNIWKTAIKLEDNEDDWTVMTIWVLRVYLFDDGFQRGACFLLVDVDEL